MFLTGLRGTSRCCCWARRVSDDGMPAACGEDGGDDAEDDFDFLLQKIQLV